MSLHTGMKFFVPFDMLVIFRPIWNRATCGRGLFTQNKIQDKNRPSDYRAVREIFRQMCEKNGVVFNEDSYRF